MQNDLGPCSGRPPGNEQEFRGEKKRAVYIITALMKSALASLRGKQFGLVI